jgi:hypothetical protein
MAPYKPGRGIFDRGYTLDFYPPSATVALALTVVAKGSENAPIWNEQKQPV